MKLLSLTTFLAFSTSLASVAAFAPATTTQSSRTTSALASTAPSKNGWTPDPSKPCYGLPGAIAPLGFFDPLGFTKDKPLSEVKRLREAELMHGRVGMMAVVGYFVAEATPTIAFGTDHTLIANNMIPNVPIAIMYPFFLIINFAEAYRATRGWKEPSPDTLFTIRDNYYPGDLGFDPFYLKPDDPATFARLHAKEISNGRLAMLAAAGFMAQELSTGQPIFGF